MNAGPFLSQERFFDPRLPVTWQSVLEDLRSFSEIERALREDPEGPHGREEELRTLHDRLVFQSAALLESEAIRDLSERDAARIFARSVFCLKRLKEAVTGSMEVLDTAGSRTLPLYEADFYRSPANAEHMRKRLEACAGLSPSELASIQASVEEDLGDARRKQRIMQAIAEEFDLRADAPDLRQNVFRLLQAFYPDAPLLPEEVEIVLTATLLFFCVPFQGTQLTTSRFDKLPKSEREPIEAFLGKSSHTPLSQFAHFPMFGHFRGTDADAGLLERLATRSGVACEVVARELSCMATILPLAEVDKFIVHDVWGHGWQASMLQFESLYVRMSTYGEPLALETTAQLSSGETLKLGGCFQQSSSTVVLDEARFSSFIEAEIAERIPVAFSAALAEIMADVGEFKFLTLHPGAEELLPSSSLFKMFPSKLDLILQDMSLYYELATRLFRDGLGVSSERDRLVQALVERGATPESARAAVDQAAASWRTLSESVYAPRLEWTVENDVAMEVNLFTRLALNLLGIHRAICTAYRDLDEIQLRDLPLKSFKDLLVIAASVFFEIDPRRNLWRVDEFLTLVFVPWCCRFGAKR